MRQANPERVRDSLRAIFGKRHWLGAFYGDPAPMMARMADAIERCHDAVIAPHWERMRVILEADIEHRARVLSDRGAEAVISDLHDEIRWADGDVIVWPAAAGRDDGEVIMHGAGLVLNPNIFGWPHCSAAMRPTGAASLRYPARGIGTLWETRAEQPIEAMRELLGPTRAGILVALAELSDTPTLARQLGVTPGAVSQHLRVLRDAGLVRTQKTGRTALHLRTAKADALLGDGEPDGAPSPNLA